MYVSKQKQTYKHRKWIVVPQMEREMERDKLGVLNQQIQTTV